ncbi:MAG TPA: DUF2795 domain-containing protein [Pseudonocardiaceae bacterium]|jgi:hypothetical protein|nr:DUF2795 domain-containing protein [Pseudonocardiaceae bacterium]
MPERNQFDQTLRFVLAGLDFPARRWQILAQADFYGADIVTTLRLRRLPPDQSYRDLGEVLETLARTARPSEAVPGDRGHRGEVA